MALAQPAMKKEDDRDDEEEYSPFLGIEKGAVLQEARVFNDPHVDARRCSQVITKLLYLLNQGEVFTKVEATEVFFAVTKLFQSKDVSLRRMVYLMIKELSPSADEVIIVTSSLMKDMNSKTDLYRANAIRVLCRITDGALLGQIERYIKQALVDKNPVVASAALVSGIHLLQTNSEIVKRWSNEVQEAIQSRAALVQFHALALLHKIRQNDRLAVSKLVTSLTRGSVRSPLAQCLLVRYTSQVIRETTSFSQTGDRPFYDFLEGCLRNKNDMVILEAARAITELNGVTSRELTPAITVLQLFLSSSKPVLRFAAVRTLNKVAMTHPLAVTNCNIDMESLISDQNRSALCSSRNCCIFAQYEGRRDSGAGEFIAGFVLGGVVFGALGYFFQPQVTKTFFGAKDGESENSPINIDDDEGIEKTRRNLNEKIAKLNAAIDGVSAQLRADNGFTYSDDSAAELESAA